MLVSLRGKNDEEKTMRVERLIEKKTGEVCT